ncbi:tail fiber assembly protein [Kosakonia oryzae]|uniref:Tail fiber assembly protein n=1 Tax=Kosakonia oryzae TaxID=497725 RepID=A0AA94H4J0_9ENTR|nr:tail fiber assembly protein [Kosakonia oryzae]ANI81786.1 tail fiber assembly protein [Kosakonia oryzae]SFC73834.1 virus tail fibre assembly protein, lambda gpK [Kosakonia oryzae]
MTSAVLDKAKIATTAGNITVYGFSAQTGEFTGSSEEFLAIGVGLPAGSTDIAPGTVAEGCVAIFTGSSWEQQEDHRGETAYSTVDLSASTVDYIGPLKDGFVATAPTTPYDRWNGSAWITDAEAQQVAAVQDAQALRQQHIDTAMSSISVIQLKLQAGRTLNDEEKNRLDQVLDYIDAINAIDLSSAPNITWPTQPA